MTTFSDATVSEVHDASAARANYLQLSRLNRPTLLNSDVVSRLNAAARDRSGLVIASTHVGEIVRAFNNRGGVVADPDVVSVALYKAPRTGLGWKVNRLPHSIQVPHRRHPTPQRMKRC